jgi:hypothetical protein
METRHPAPSYSPVFPNTPLYFFRTSRTHFVLQKNFEVRESRFFPLSSSPLSFLIMNALKQCFALLLSAPMALFIDIRFEKNYVGEESCLVLYENEC